MTPLHIFIIANTAQGGGISGGDKIFIECARQWVRLGHRVSIAVWEEGEAMCRRNGLDGVEYVVWPSRRWKRFGFAVCYIARVIRGCWGAWRSGVRPDVIYSASDFWPDVLPAVILRNQSPNAVWIGGLYFFAPSPWPSERDKAYRGSYRFPTFRSLVYFFSQWPMVRMLKRAADLIVVANDLDVQRLEGEGRSPGTALALYGGVDVETIDQAVPDASRRYDGCFVGRFHRQKGVLELIRIWKLVCDRRPGSRLAVIGMGDVAEENELRRLIAELRLSSQVEVLGYMDGLEKYRVMKSCRVFLHTAVLDTGGMAAAEGMGCGLPVVGFDLPGYRYIYPRGMVKAPVNDLAGYADCVVNLLSDESSYQRWAAEALAFSRQWDWRVKARLLSDRMIYLKEENTRS